jgi:hypothetical protein
VAFLREVIMKTMKDKDFLDEATKMGHDIDPISGDEVAKIVNDTIHAPADVIAVARTMIPKKKKKKKE